MDAVTKVNVISAGSSIYGNHSGGQQEPGLGLHAVFGLKGTVHSKVESVLKRESYCLMLRMDSVLKANREKSTKSPTNPSSASHLRM